MAMITNNIPDVPEDIMVEIMARLPVRSLLRFKCVCKSWYSHIQHPSFASKHLSYASSSSNHDRVLLMHSKLGSKKIGVTVLSSSVEEDFILNKFSIVPMPFFDNEEDDYRMINDVFYEPCNGIICVLGDHASNERYKKGDLILLWNPSTREIKRLPVSLFPYQDDDVAVRSVQIGFGFDPKSSVYKVVRISKLESTKNLDILKHPLVEIYDSSTDCWRKIEAVVPRHVRGTRWGSAYLDGFHYWWCGDENGNSILTFSFEDETFGIIPPPALENSEYLYLLKYKESIAISAIDSEIGAEAIDSVALWVLKQDDRKYSWVKLFKIMLTENFQVVGCLTNGKALILNYLVEHESIHGELVLYDPTSRSCSPYTQALMGYDVDYAFYPLQLFNYVESLVSFQKCYDFGLRYTKLVE